MVCLAITLATRVDIAAYENIAEGFQIYCLFPVKSSFQAGNAPCICAHSATLLQRRLEDEVRL